MKLLAASGALTALQFHKSTTMRSLYIDSVILCAALSLLCGFLLGQLASGSPASPLFTLAGFLGSLAGAIATLLFAIRNRPARVLELRSNVAPDAAGDLRPDFVHHDGTAARCTAE